LLIAIAMSD